MIFDVLNRNLNVFDRHFLEASAGTGKTFAIEHLVTRLILEGKTSFSLEQILVVTFTRAATRELKKRIRLNLWRAKEQLLDKPAIDYLKAITEKGEKAVKEALYKIEAALINYDSAQIYTLHGFCHRILNEYAFEADVGLDIGHPEKQEHLFLLEKWIKDHLKEEVAALDCSPAQMKILLNKYKGDFRRMITALVDAVNNGKKIAPHPNFTELFQGFLEEIVKFEEIDKSKFKSDVEALKQSFRKIDEKDQVELFGELLESKQCKPAQFDKLLRGNFFLSKMTPEYLKVKAKTPDGLYYPGLLQRLQNKLLPFIEKAKDPSAIFLRLAHDFKDKTQFLLEKKEKFSPDDLLLKVQSAANSARFVECVRQKYRAAIIDEFQDTDPVQWNIFQKLFMGQLETICLVGDPKQSIYSFRNADVYTYLDAAKAMGVSTKKYLDTNYRSTPALVEALNFLFSRVKGDWMVLPRQAQALKVAAVKAGMKIHSSEIPLQFFIASGKRGRSNKFPASEMLKKKIYPYIAAEISSLHHNGVEFHDIAILIKDRYMAKDIVDYLNEHGIPAKCKRGTSITESIAYFALKELLSAVSLPYDLGKLKAALAGPLIAWDSERISKGLEDACFLQAKAQMQSLHHLLFEKGFGPFFQTLLKTCWGDAPLTLLEEILQRGEVSLYLDLRKLSELIVEEAILRDLKGPYLLTFLEQIAIESERDDARLKIPSQEETGSVIVMTMHMSKGLEFDTVFALGIGARHKPSDQIIIKREGASQLTAFDAEDPACQLSLEEQDAEKMRQLYVTLTRAKKRLYVPLFLDEEQKSIEMGEASAIELFFARLVECPSSHLELYQSVQSLNQERVKKILDSLAPQIHYRVLEEMPEVSYGTTSASVELIPPSPLCLPCYDEQLFSFTSLSKKDSSYEMAAPTLDAPPSPHTLPLGSETGQLLHLLFEQIFKRGLHHPLDEAKLDALIEDELSFSPLQEWSSLIYPWVLDLLKKKLLYFSLADVPGRQIQQEMEFFFPVAKGMMKGFCDLLFEYQGKYYLLDWKSNYLGPSDADYTQEKMIQAMQSNDYFLQASIYASALKRYVKLFDNRPFSKCFGGAIYYFVRGKAAYHFIPKSFK